jgi:hypothetical protein
MGASHCDAAHRQLPLVRWQLMGMQNVRAFSPRFTYWV